MPLKIRFLSFLLLLPIACSREATNTQSYIYYDKYALELTNDLIIHS